MKTSLISIFLLIINFSVLGQTRNVDFYFEQAKANSPLINKSKNENKINDLNYQQIRNMLTKPEISIESSVLFAPIITHDNNANRFRWVSDASGNYSGYAQESTDGGQYQAYLSVNLPLINKSALRTYSEQTCLAKQINENSIVLNSHELKMLVNYQYILCLKSGMQKEISASLLKEMSRQLTIMQKLVDEAVFKQTDLILLQITYQNLQVGLKTFQDEYRSNLYDLNLLCGIKDTTCFSLKELDLQPTPEKKESSDFSVSYRLDSLNLVNGQKIYELKYKPQVSLFLNTGLNAVYQPAMNRLGFSTGITFSWNLFDGNQRKLEKEKTKINLSNVEFEKRNFLTQADINRQKVLDQIRSLNQRLDITEKQLDQYEQLLKVYSMELSAGEVSVTDFKNLFQDIASKKQDEILLKMEKQLLINTYQYWNY